MMGHPSRHTQFLSFCSDRIIWKKQPKGGEEGYSSLHLRAQSFRAGMSMQKGVKAANHITSAIRKQRGINAYIAGFLHFP